MDDTTELTSPPAITIYPLGDVMAAVAEVLRGHLPDAVVVSPADDGTPVDDGAAAAPGPARPSARLALVLLAAGTPLPQAQAVLSAVAAAHPRQTRVWIAVAAQTEQNDLRALDELLDDPGHQQPVDAVVVLPAARPAAMALAMEAWIRLRHDAPSAALADLRDTTGACRFAAVVAVAPAAAPPAPTAPGTETPAQPTGPGPAAHGEHALMVLRQGLDEVDRTARASAGAHVARHVSDTAGPPEAAELTPSPPAAPTDELNRIMAAVAPDDAIGLRAAQRACAEEATESLGPAADADLAQAVLEVVQADTAWQVESSRTGLAARVGRRKRLDQARVRQDLARQKWSAAYVEAAARGARRAAAAALQSRFDDAAVLAEQRAAQRAADRGKEATARWLADAVATAAGLQPPGQVDQAGLSRAWGRAAPAVRRYLLVPGGVTTDADQVTLAPAAPDEVMVVAAPDAAGPMAVAVVMGVPLAALQVSYARDSNMPMAAAKPSTERGS